MEPLFLPEDEQSLLPQELHPAVRDLSATTNLGTGLGGRNTQELGQDKDKPIGGGGAGDHGGEEEFKRRGQVRGKLEYDRHSVHVVTQYYVPDDHRRAREVNYASHPVGLDCPWCHAVQSLANARCTFDSTNQLILRLTAVAEALGHSPTMGPHGR